MHEHVTPPRHRDRHQSGKAWDASHASRALASPQQCPQHSRRLFRESRFGPHARIAQPAHASVRRRQACGRAAPRATRVGRAALPRAHAPAAERRGRRDLAQQAEGDDGRGQERRDAAAAHPPHQRQQRRHREHGRAVHQEACARAACWSGMSAGRSCARMQPSAWGSCSTVHRCAGVSAVRRTAHDTPLRARPAISHIARPRTERGGAGHIRQPVRPPQQRAEDRRRCAGGVRRRAGRGVREEDRERDRQRPGHDGHPLAATPSPPGREGTAAPG